MDKRQVVRLCIINAVLLLVSLMLLIQEFQPGLNPQEILQIYAPPKIGLVAFWYFVPVIVLSGTAISLKNIYLNAAISSGIALIFYSYLVYELGAWAIIGLFNPVLILFLYLPIVTNLVAIGRAFSYVWQHN